MVGARSPDFEYSDKAVIGDSWRAIHHSHLAPGV